MNRKMHKLIGGILSLLLVAGCSKGYADFGPNDADPAPDASASDPMADAPESSIIAIATLTESAGYRFLSLMDGRKAYVSNPEIVAGFPAPSRILAELVELPGLEEVPGYEYRVYVYWANLIETGLFIEEPEGSCEEAPDDDPSATNPPDPDTELTELYGAPLEILEDWLTSCADGFVTLHYNIDTSGEVHHSFRLQATGVPQQFLLFHDDGGDAGGTLSDGLVAFQIAPEGEETGPITLQYLYWDGQVKTLTLPLDDLAGES